MCDTINDCLHVMPSDISNNEMPPNSYRGIIIENNESTLQLAGTNEGSHIADIVFTAVPSSGANKHWILTHRGPSLNNRFSIGYTSNNLGNFNTLIAAPEQFTLLTNGNVGIGTPTPEASLHIYSANNPTTLRIQSSAGFGAGRLEFWSDPQGSSPEWRPGFIQSTDQAGGTWTGGLAFFVNGTGFDNRTAEVEVMRITNGNVGIGTTNPQAALEVIPSDYSKPWLQLGRGGDAGRLWVEYPQAGSGYSLAPNLVMSDLDDPPRIRFQQMGSQTEADPEFESWIGHGRGRSNDVAIMGGNVGIGTVNPQAKLDVNGDIKLKDWTLSVPDYVFEKNYNLRNLDELQTYINSHKHLPEMPSAEKVSEEGVNLGEFCMSLLKKIEELSLYVLQQHEIIQGQNERLAKLERSANL
ncbi:MAG: hypothetical protein QNJ47_14365 [Nostocaceae cyanobacterium]|nr:hypothetical protein [Nostocaceae cyanobacterium]